EVAVLAAGSTVAMMTIHFPIVPGAPFLKYDPSDAVGLLAGFLLGPGPGVLTVLLKDALFWLIRDGNPLGPLADFIAAATFVGVAAHLFRRLAPGGRPGAGEPGGRLAGVRAAALPAMAAAILGGTLARVLVMVAANFPILYLEFGMPPEKVAALLWPAIIPFNGLKGLLNGAFAVVLAAALVRRSTAVVASR
ncbi:MAG: ECF transporter S component, partial [Bacillota bacterium]